MAEIGYIQVVRDCNHRCVFCSNPARSGIKSYNEIRRILEDFAGEGYFGVAFTGGEPTLHPDIDKLCSCASGLGLHTRLITNGSVMADPEYVKVLAKSGLQLVHVSVYSVRPGVEEAIRGIKGTIDRACAAIENAYKHGIEVNINCVINRKNADHLDENIRFFIKRHPYIRHFIFNNLDPSMGRAVEKKAEYTPKLRDFRDSLHRAMNHLYCTGRTFRVEKVPLCFMAGFPWASTETRKIVKSEKRTVYFLDEKDKVVQKDWEQMYAPVCKNCSVRPVCAGLFSRGQAYDPAELKAVSIDCRSVVDRILNSA